MHDQIRGFEVDEFHFADEQRPEWMKAAFEMLQRRGKVQRDPFIVGVDMGKTAAALAVMQQTRESFVVLGHALERSQRAVGGLRASFVIFDELSAQQASPWGIEPLPKKKRDWRDQTPPVAVEQRKRGPGVVLMRDRTGKLVERQL